MSKDPNDILSSATFQRIPVAVPSAHGQLDIQNVNGVLCIVDDAGVATAIGAASGDLGKLIEAEFVATSDAAAVPFSCAVPGLLIGATPKALVDLTGVLTSAQVAAFFEATCTVAGHFQQTGAFAGGDISVFGSFRNP